MTYKGVYFTCAYCGKEYYTKNYNKSAKKHFCCLECRKKYNSEIEPNRGVSFKINNCKCDYCGKDFHKTPSTIKKHNFCSRTCQNTYFAHKLRDETHKQLNCKCDYCGKEFHKKPSAIGKLNFCDKKCLDSYRKQLIVTKQCLICGKTFTTNQYHKDSAKFCSTKCQITHQRRFYKKVKCSYCGKKILVDKTRQKYSKNNRYFCSNKCIGKYYRGDKSPAYKGTSSILDILRTYYDRKQRGICFAKYSKICQICGAKAEHVHHIYPLHKIVDDYIKNNKIDIDKIQRYKIAYDIIKNDAKFLDNSNLIPLCKKCHSKQHRNKGGNFMNITNIEYGMSDNSYNIFFSGCKGMPKCEGCCNPENWDFSRGESWLKYIDKITEDLQKYTDLIKKIIIVGGEPLDQDLVILQQFIDFIKKFNIPIYLFTRYDLKDVPDFVKQKCDFIKCGEYIPSLQCNDNIQYGIKLATSNQKIYKKGEDY